MSDRKATPSARALAAERILDRGYGRPPQTNTIVAAPTRRARELTDDELAAIILGATGAEEQPLLVGPELQPVEEPSGEPV